MRMLNWLKKSNRYKHISVGFALGLISVILAVIAGVYKEKKDKKNVGYFDKADFVCTIIGGIVGNAVSSIIIYLIIK